MPATRRAVVGFAALTPFSAPANSHSMTYRRENGDVMLATLWGALTEADERLAALWAAVEGAQNAGDHQTALALAEAADAMGHEHDHIVRKIVSQRAETWRGVAIKLMAWRLLANLSEEHRPDADDALVFSSYLDALRLSPSASGTANDAAVKRLVLRCPRAVK